MFVEERPPAPPLPVARAWNDRAIGRIRRLLASAPTAPTLAELDALATALQRAAPRWLSVLVRFDGRRLVVDYHDGSNWRVLERRGAPRRGRLDLVRERAQLRKGSR